VITWALALISIAATVLSGRKVWWGWLLAAASCAGWTVYAVATDQLGLAALNGFYVALTLYNARRWRREEQRAERRREHSRSA
jgi:hypothetical protein